MKLILTDLAGNGHDLDNVIIGLAGDIHMLNERMKRVENELGIEPEVIEAEAETDDAAKSE